MNPQDMDYNAAGFDNFMSRSIDQTPQINLDSPAPPNNAVAFDRTQTTGPLGDTFRVGNMLLDGVSGRISVFDDSGNEVVRIGNLDG